jgi:predicted transcriptional regulator
MSERTFDNPTKPELAILKLLWRSRELSARDIHSAIEREFEWSYSTVRTVLERMADKGLISKTAVGGVNMYEAEVTKVSMLGRMIADFSKRVLELDSAPAAAFFSDSKLLSETELSELEDMLREAEDKS